MEEAIFSYSLRWTFSVGMCSCHPERFTTSGQSSKSGVPQDSNIILSCFPGPYFSSPGNSGVPTRISPNMQPTLHMSMLVLYFLHPNSSSGGRYQRVMTLFVYCAFPRGWKWRANPKSPSFSSPLLLSNKLAPLMSLWIMWFACKYWMACIICMARHFF